MLSKASTLRVALITAMALLIAQFGAEAHAYSHVHAGSHAGDSYDPGGRLCSECSAFAPLLATADGPAYLFAILPQGTPPAADAAFTSRLAALPTPAFRSRAPPLRP